MSAPKNPDPRMRREIRAAFNAERRRRRGTRRLLPVDGAPPALPLPISQTVGADSIVIGAIGAAAELHINQPPKKVVHRIVATLPNAMQARLRELVEELAALEERAGATPGKARIKWWAQLKRRMGVAAYARIPVEHFDEAVVYLQEQLGRLAARGARRVPAAYRRHRYRGIYARLRGLGWTKKDLERELLGRYGTASLTDLGLDELERAYQWIRRYR